MIEIRPQPIQERFLASPADIAIMGGAAGGGKTMALIMECIRHIGNKQFSAIIFRRESKQIMLPGGLFDTAIGIFSGLKATYRTQPILEFRFPQGSKVVMTHMNLETDTSAFQGSQIPLICWDELCHFSYSQFFFMLSRNRSLCGVKPYIRASCNPDPDSWVAEFIEWWIDQETGLPIEERSGKLRYFVTVPTESETRLVWGNTPEEAALASGAQRPPSDLIVEAQQYIERCLQDGVDPEQRSSLAGDLDFAMAVQYLQLVKSAKSVTFIPAKVYDNPALMRANPEYLANLKAMDRVGRARLLEGNWKVRAVAGSYFARSDAILLPDIPGDVVRWVRSWDLASMEPNEINRDPDWTVGMKLGRRRDGSVVIAEVLRFRRNASLVRQLVLETARRDGRDCWIQIPRDPGQAGVDQAESYEQMLAGFSLFMRPILRNKVSQAEPAAAAWQQGRIYCVQGPNVTEMLDEFERFPGPRSKDDCVDALSGGYNLLPAAESPDYGAGGLSRRFSTRPPS